MPYDTPAEVIERMDPDGVFLSNGPGDPEDVAPVIVVRCAAGIRSSASVWGIR